MKDLKYFRPMTITELKEQINQPGAQILAGGTEIVPQMRQGKFQVSILIDTSGVNAMRFIEDQGSDIILGALTTHQEVADSALLKNVNPALVTAAHNISCRHTRIRGTLGGTIANASPAADILPSLMIFDAVLLIQSLNEERRVFLEDFLIGPGQTDLKKGEFIHSISFKPLYGAHGSSFIKVERRSGKVQSDLSAAVALTLDGQDQLSDIRIALGAIAPIVIRCRKMEKILQGKKPELSLIKEISEIYQKEITPLVDVDTSEDYQGQLVAVIIQRALEIAVDQALGSRQ